MWSVIAKWVVGKLAGSALSSMFKSIGGSLIPMLIGASIVFGAGVAFKTWLVSDNIAELKDDVESERTRAATVVERQRLSALESKRQIAEAQAAAEALQRTEYQKLLEASNASVERVNTRAAQTSRQINALMKQLEEVKRNDDDAGHWAATRIPEPILDRLRQHEAGRGN